MMRKPVCLLCCLALGCSCLFGAALAGEAPALVIRDDEHMLLESRDVFSYDSSELHNLRHKRGLTDDQEIGSWGFVGDFAEDYNGVLALYFPFDGFQVVTATNGSTVRNNEEVASLLNAWYAHPDDRMICPVVAVYVDKPGIIGRLASRSACLSKPCCPQSPT